MTEMTLDKRTFVRNASQYLKEPGFYLLIGRDRDIEVEVRHEIKTRAINSYIGL